MVLLTLMWQQISLTTEHSAQHQVGHVSCSLLDFFKTVRRVQNRVFYGFLRCDCDHFAGFDC